MVELSFRKSMYFAVSMSRWVAVSGQAGVQAGCAAGAQVAANVGRADQQDLGLVRP